MRAYESVVTRITGMTGHESHGTEHACEPTNVKIDATANLFATLATFELLVLRILEIEMGSQRGLVVHRKSGAK